MKIKKLAKRILIGLLIFVTVVLAFRAVLNWVETAKLNKAIVALKARGVPLTIKDLVPGCPDTDNAASLWKAAEELWNPEKKDLEFLTEFYMKYYQGTAIEPEQAANILMLAEKNKKALQLFEEAADKSCFIFGSITDKFFSQKRFNLNKFLQMIKLIGMNTVVQAETGNLPDSVKRLRAGFRLALRIADESSLISSLVSIAGARSLLYSLGRATQNKAADPEFLASLMNDLAFTPWKNQFVKCIRGERFLLLAAGLGVVHHDTTSWAELIGDNNFFHRVFFWLIRPLGKRDIRLSLPLYDQIESLANQPYYKTYDFFKAYPDGERETKWYQFVSKIIVPNYHASFLKEAALEAMLLTARTGLACRVYKANNGRYPDNLDALVPGVLSEIPIDPFTGNPLVYRRQAEGFIVYSLGSNQKDDGGRSTFQIYQIVAASKDDWNWKEDK